MSEYRSRHDLSSEAQLLDLETLFQPQLRQNPLWLEEAVTDVEAGKILGLSRTTLASQRCRGEGPPWFKVGARAVRYTRRGCFEYRRRGVRTSTSDLGPDGSNDKMRVVT